MSHNELVKILLPNILGNLTGTSIFKLATLWGMQWGSSLLFSFPLCGSWWLPGFLLLQEPLRLQKVGTLSFVFVRHR